MKRSTHLCRPSLPRAAFLLALTLLFLPANAHEAETTIGEPGFRPASEHADTFIAGLEDATIAVLPTIVRRKDRSAVSFDSQQRIVAYLNEHEIGAASRRSLRIDLGPLRRQSQWDMFQYAARSITEKLASRPSKTDYTLIMELLVPGDRAVFGIELYIVDKAGRHVFSLLLNEHHKMFTEAKLYAGSSSQEARDAMILSATRVGLDALHAQIDLARECAAAAAALEIRTAETGVLQDFEAALPSGTGKNGVPLGFSSFSDGRSTLNIGRTSDYPAREGAIEGGMTLRVDAEVENWAGFTRLFTNDAVDTWTPQDWRNADGLSFWLHGNNSGTTLFVDVLDNRNPCSRWDDAERFAFNFVDDVAGWRLVKVPFAAMTRKEIGNNAPNDGLGLAQVHGWAFGVLHTDTPQYFYIDDVSLWSHAPGTVGVWFEETRLDESSSRMVIDQRQSRGLAAEKAMNLMCECASLATSRGFPYFRIDQRSQLADGKASFRITFYDEPPGGFPILPEANQGSVSNVPDPENATFDAEAWLAPCRMAAGSRR